MLSSYFITGTGRCGTLLLAKLLNCSELTMCNHEYSIDTRKFKKAIRKDRLEIINGDVDRVLKPTIEQYNGQNMSYGECSGHLYPLIPELYRRYEYSTRFILLIRNPVDFVRSALARGFFNRAHPYPLEHVVPPKSTEMGARWAMATPLEKCAWYWAMVNGMVYRFFLGLPHTLWRIVPIESMSIKVVEDLYDFLQLKDFDNVKAACEQLLSVRHNASPGQSAESVLNPYSKEVLLGPLETWSQAEVEIFTKHVQPINELMYGENICDLRNSRKLCVLK